MLIPAGAFGWVADVLPVQLVRIGSIVLIALAQEVTIVAGLRLRRAVAEVLDLPVDRVLVQGYANDYAGYVTTPEEYGAQRYEGGHTMFGKWELPAYVQEVSRVARAMAEGGPSDSLDRSPSNRQPRPARQRNDEPYRCTAVVRQPAPAHQAGEPVTAEFAVSGDGGPLLSSYLVVEQQVGDDWSRVADDGDWSTTIEWRRGDGRTVAHAAWRPSAESTGTFRLSYVDVDKVTSSAEFTIGSRTG
jgi:neutral ceramidase